MVVRKGPIATAIPSYESPVIPFPRGSSLRLLSAIAHNAAMESEPPKADLPKCKRRWFQFSLRTLLTFVVIVAIPCAYVGWEAKIVRERRTLLDSIKAVGGLDVTDIIHNDAGPPPPSWLRRVLGDETVELLLVPITTDEETMAQLHRRFPETRVLKKNENGALFSDR
jgi:hypothetical protein